MNCDELVQVAWAARESAYPWKSGTKVGCALLLSSGRVVTGSNIEGQWMTSLHAEVSAIAKIDPNTEKIKIIVVVAETESFTPCGACADWLYQFAECGAVLYTENKYRERRAYQLSSLMPHYPIR